MRLTVFGASGGVGKHIVRLAHARGHSVRAVYRSDPGLPPADGFEPVIIRDLTRDAGLSDAVRGADAVVSSLGLRRRYPWNPFSALTSPPDFTSQFARRLTDTLRGDDMPRRVVAVSAGGVGDSWRHVNLPFRLLVRASNVGVAYDDLERMEEVLRASALDWTCVRPTTLTNGALTQQVRETRTYALWSRISRVDVAWFMLQCAEQAGTSPRTPMVTHY